MIGIKTQHALARGGWWDRPNDTSSPADVVAEIAYPEQGGAVVWIRGQVPGALFAPGQIEVPEAAIGVMEASGLRAWPLLQRHVQGDWGTFGRVEDRPAAARLNLRAIETNEGRVVSGFPTRDGRYLWIITHLGEGGYTTFLLSGDR